MAKPGSPGTPTLAGPEAARLLEQIVAERREARLVGEGGERQLAELLQIGLAVDAGKDLAGLVDDDLDGVGRHGDRRDARRSRRR